MSRDERREMNARIWAPIIAAARRRLTTKRAPRRRVQVPVLHPVGICEGEPECTKAFVILLYGPCQLCGISLAPGEDVFVRPMTRGDRVLDFMVAHPGCERRESTPLAANLRKTP